MPDLIKGNKNLISDNLARIRAVCDRIAHRQTNASDEFKCRDPYARKIVYQTKLSRKLRLILGEIAKGKFVVLGAYQHEHMNGFDNESVYPAIDKYTAIKETIFTHSEKAEPPPIP